MLHFLVFVVVLSANCPVGELSSCRRTFPSADCPVDELSCRLTVPSAYCPVGELPCRQTVLSANCPIGELSCRWTVLSVNCLVGELSVGEQSVGELSVDEVSVYPRCPRWYDCTKSDTVCVPYVYTSPSRRVTGPNKIFIAFNLSEKTFDAILLPN